MPSIYPPQLPLEGIKTDRKLFDLRHDQSSPLVSLYPKIIHTPIEIILVLSEFQNLLDDSVPATLSLFKAVV